MTDPLLRVAVISPNQLIRAGLVDLIAQLDERAMVTEAVAVDEQLSSHDVAIYDIGGVADAYSDLRRLIESDAQVIGLVYDRMRDAQPPELEETSHIITLSVTRAAERRPSPHRRLGRRPGRRGSPRSPGRPERTRGGDPATHRD